MRHALLVAFIASAAPLALAQSSASPSEAGRQFEAGRTADLQNWQWRAQRGAQPTEAERAVSAVLDAVTARDCAGAAAKLNAGLAKGYRELQMLAGAMYEEGICLKPSWERAVVFYERALAAGAPGAAARLSAGYASAAGGRDIATSLWWSLKASTALPAPCGQVAPLVDDADKFVAALNAWPAGQLKACAYAAAVMATVQAETESSSLAAAYGLEGKLRFVFVPEQGRIDIADEVAGAAQATGVVADAAARERAVRAARTALAADMRQLADRALKRFDKPAGVPPAWRVEAEVNLKVTR